MAAIRPAPEGTSSDERPLSLRVIRCLPVTWQCSALRGQASDKPRGRKPRAAVAQRNGALELWGFESRGQSAATSGSLEPLLADSRARDPRPSHQKKSLRLDSLPPHAWAMAGSPLKRKRKAGVTDPVTGGLVQFPRLTHPRAGLSHAQWRALGPGEKLERLFSMSLDDLYEIMSWEPLAELDPVRLSVRMQATRVVFTICMKAFLDGRLGREADRERDRQRIIEELARLEFGTSNKA